MLPGDRLACAFVERQSVGAAIKIWPLHATVVPWFRLDVASHELAAELTEKLQAIAPFTAKISGQAQFGHQAGKLVSLVKLPSSLEMIEQRVRGLLKSHHAWLADETTKVRRPYRPHVTAQGCDCLKSGASFICHSLYIVEQKGDYKEIVGKVLLRGSL